MMPTRALYGSRSLRRTGVLLAAALLGALLLGACAPRGEGDGPRVQVRGKYDVAIGVKGAK
jgi:hypothetical protein